MRKQIYGGMDKAVKQLMCRKSDVMYGCGEKISLEENRPEVVWWLWILFSPRLTYTPQISTWSQWSLFGRWIEEINGNKNENGEGLGNMGWCVLRRKPLELYSSISCEHHYRQQKPTFHSRSLVQKKAYNVIIRTSSVADVCLPSDSHEKNCVFLVYSVRHFPDVVVFFSKKNDAFINV